MTTGALPPQPDFMSKYCVHEWSRKHQEVEYSELLTHTPFPTRYPVAVVEFLHKDKPTAVTLLNEGKGSSLRMGSQPQNQAPKTFKRHSSPSSLQ